MSKEENTERFTALISMELNSAISELVQNQREYKPPRAFSQCARKIIEFGVKEYFKDLNDRGLYGN